MAGLLKGAETELELCVPDEEIVGVEGAQSEDADALGCEWGGEGREDADLLEREWTVELDDAPPTLGPLAAGNTRRGAHDGKLFGRSGNRKQTFLCFGGPRRERVSGR